MKKKNGTHLMDGKMLFGLFSVLVIIMVLMSVTYKYTVVRYSIIVVLLLGTILFRKKIMSILSVISIIVPIYNSEQYLKHCLDTIMNQTYSTFECLMVDDGSTDNSSDICTEYVKKDTRFKYLRKNRGGVAHARNYGLSHANGEYIAFVDNDDLLCPKMYEALISNLEEQNCDVSCCTYSKDYDSYEAIEKKLANCQLTNEEVLVFSGLNDIYDSIVRGKGHKAIEELIWNKVYKKSIIGDLKFNEHISLVDDADFTLRLFRNVRKVCYVDAVFYHWMQHITNQTSKRSIVDA